MAFALGELAGARLDQGDLARALVDYREALSVAVESKNESLIARILGDHACLQYDLGDPKSAARDFSRARAIAGALGDRESEGMYAAQEGLALARDKTRAGREQAKAALESARALGKRSGDVWTRTIAELGLARLFAEASPSSQEARDAALRAVKLGGSDEHLAFSTQLELGLIEYSRKDMNRARAAFEEAEKAATKVLEGAPRTALAHYVRAVARLALGRGDTGLTDLKDGFSISRAPGVLGDVQGWLARLFQVHPAASVDAAIALIREAR
jgi:tetratricopeptide (TPR) repeat protein